MITISHIYLKYITCSLENGSYGKIIQIYNNLVLKVGNKNLNIEHMVLLVRV